MPQAVPAVARFLGAAKSDPTLWTALGLAASQLGHNKKILDQQFLTSGFVTSNRTPFPTVQRLFRMSAHGLVNGGPALQAAKYNPVSDTAQTRADLAKWGLVDPRPGSHSLPPLGVGVMAAFDANRMAGTEPTGGALREFNFRFFELISRLAHESPPPAWLIAQGQADRMIAFASARWSTPLDQYQVALLDFLSCDTIRSASHPIPVSDWRNAWASTASLNEWSDVGKELCETGGELTDRDGSVVAPILRRYFASDQKGGDRPRGLTYDIFSYLCNQPPIDEPSVPVPVNVVPVTTAAVRIRVRQRTEPGILKRLANFKCQLCGGSISRQDDDPYVEAAHILPFAGLTEDGIPGNYLVACPDHHKIIDLGDATFVVPAGPAPTVLKIRLQDVDGTVNDYDVRPLQRQVDHGFWDAVRTRSAARP